MPTTYRKIFVEYTEKELLKMSREEACLNLNDKQRLFCEYYVSKMNAVLAAKKAGYSPRSAASAAWKLRQNPDCIRYIAWLRLRVAKETHIEASDLIDQYIRIAFADITDYIDIKNGNVFVKNPDLIDGQVVKSIKQTRDGLQIELYDKFIAMNKLERFFGTMPKDWKEKIEEKKLEILQEKLELEKLKLGMNEEDETLDDGLIEALKETASNVWETNEEDDTE
jgi:phage terminase small subunit